MDRYLLTLEFPINEGYIWVQIKDNELCSAPVAMCLNCGGFSYCEETDCVGCEHRHPEMSARKDRVTKLYTDISPWLEELAIEFKNRVDKKLNEL